MSQVVKAGILFRHVGVLKFQDRNQLLCWLWTRLDDYTPVMGAS